MLRGGEEQARRVALTMVQALIDADAATLDALFAERVVQVRDGRATARQALIDRCLEKARALSYEPDVGVEDVIDMASARAEPLTAPRSGSPLPPGLQEGDLRVALSPQPGDSRDLWRQVPCFAHLYVRPGPDPRIVGLGR